MIFLEKKGSPAFVQDTIEKIRSCPTIAFSSDGPDLYSLFDGISFGPEEQIYAVRIRDDVYLAYDGSNTYALTPKEMQAIHTELLAVHNSQKQSLQK